MAGNDAPPTEALNAVLVASATIPQGTQKVEELDFNKFKGRPITVDDLYEGMKNMGFQASSTCEAIRIINEMVSIAACFWRKRGREGPLLHDRGR
jgi:deoxyhypusine synthase